MNRQTLTQPPTSNKTAKPNEKDSSYSLPSNISTISSNSKRDQSQSSKSKKKGTAELHSENKDTSPMIKGMDVMDSEAAKYKFEREKHKYSCSEHLERFRQIQISHGMDPTHAVLSAKKNHSNSGSSDSSSDSSGSSSSSSAVGMDSSNKNNKVQQVDTSSSNSSGSSSSLAAVSMDSSNKTPVAKIVLHSDNDVDISDFVDNGGGYEGNDSDKGNESDDDDKKDDGYNNATKEVILDCATGTQCKAPPSANLADSPHLCWGCNKMIHSSLLCGESILNLLSNNPSYIGRSLSNGHLIQEDENNETCTLCFKCIALLLEARKFEEAQKLNACISDMLGVPPPTARMEDSPQTYD